MLYVHISLNLLKPSHLSHLYHSFRLLFVFRDYVTRSNRVPIHELKDY